MRREALAHPKTRLRKLVMCSLILFATTVSLMVDHPAMGYPDEGGETHEGVQKAPPFEIPQESYGCNISYMCTHVVPYDCPGFQGQCSGKTLEEAKQCVEADKAHCPGTICEWFESGYCGMR
jgi:hypothetical protein